MKVVSLVPSITETLINAGVDVVGRTRFCIHPAESVKSIPIVGGTKTLDREKLAALGADILILDKEENPEAFSKDVPIPFLALHVEDIPSCASNLNVLARELHCEKLKNYAERFERLQPLKAQDKVKDKIALDRFVDWIRAPLTEQSLEYLIWRDPLMGIGKNTFVGNVLEYLGHSLPLYDSKYPKLTEGFHQERTYLFSSEPYPFQKHKDWIQSLGVPAGCVDGESFSWFGIRSLLFLETYLR